MLHERAVTMKNQRVTSTYDPRNPVYTLPHEQANQSSPLMAVFGGLGVFIVYGVLCYSTLFSLPWESQMGFTKGHVREIMSGGKQKTRVVYEYTVNNQTYTAGQMFEFHGWFLKPGDSVDVRFQPKRPTVAHIQTGFTVATVLDFLASFAGLMFTFIGLKECITGRTR